MNQIDLDLEHDYTAYLVLKTSNFSCFVSCPIMIKNILDEKFELIDQWGMLNVISRSSSDTELLSRLDDKIDEEIWEVAAEILKVEVEMESNQCANKNDLEWEIADVLEVTQSIRMITRKLTQLTDDQERILSAAINTRKYIVKIMEEYNLNIRDIIKTKNSKHKKKWWFNEWYIWWWVSYEELWTDEWLEKLEKLLT